MMMMMIDVRSSMGFPQAGRVDLYSMCRCASLLRYAHHCGQVGNTRRMDTRNGLRF